MRAGTLFQAGGIAITLGLVSSFALKAAEGYCEAAPPINPYTSEYVLNPIPDTRKRFCENVEFLKPVNWPYRDAEREDSVIRGWFTPDA